MSIWQHALMIYCILDLAALAVFVNYGATRAAADPRFRSAGLLRNPVSSSFRLY